MDSAFFLRSVGVQNSMFLCTYIRWREPVMSWQHPSAYDGTTDNNSKGPVTS